MEPWQSWTVAAAVGGAAYWYYAIHTPQRNRRGRQAVASNDPKARTNRQRGGAEAEQSSDAAASQNERGRKRRVEDKPVKKEKEVSIASFAPAAAETGNNDTNDKEFAEQLEGLKKGTSLRPPERKDSRMRTIKQSAASAEPKLSAASSTTSADADDDLSPALSPNVTAAAGDVSDMLEAPAAGPSVLRLTNSNQPERAKKPQQKREPEPAETKKQRQNRRKAEERKLQRDQDEKDRRILLEKQLRTAREARGEPAKNGMAHTKAPTSNAWTKPVNGSAAPAVQPAALNSAPLLDTFDHEVISNSSSSGPSHWEENLPEEDEQIRQLAEMDENAWSTVPTRKKGKKKPVNGTTDDTTGNEGSDGPAPAPAVNGSGAVSVPDYRDSEWSAV